MCLPISNGPSFKMEYDPSRFDQPQMSKPIRRLTINGKKYRLSVFSVMSKHGNGQPKDCYMMRSDETVKIAAPNPETGEMEGTDAEFITAWVPDKVFKGSK